LLEAFFRQFRLSAINPVLQTYAKQIYGTMIFGRQDVEQGGTFCLIIRHHRIDFDLAAEDILYPVETPFHSH
jgi:hypothetical protein